MQPAGDPGAGRRHDVSAYILAGGRSRRFGHDKATWLHQGRALTTWVSDAVQGLAGAPCLVASTDASRLGGLGLRVIADHFTGEGPAAGIHAALWDAKTPFVVVVGCDMPWLDAELLLAQLGALDGVPEAGVCAPRIGGYWEPLHAVFRRVAVEPIAAAITRGERRMQGIIELLRPLDAIAATGIETPRWEQSARSANTPDLLEGDG